VHRTLARYAILATRSILAEQLELLILCPMRTQRDESSFLQLVQCSLYALPASAGSPAARFVEGRLSASHPCSRSARLIRYPVGACQPPCSDDAPSHPFGGLEGHPC